MNEGAIRVSVVIPVYNGAPFLRQTIENIMAQDYAPREIIVIDDSSTDATPQIASSFGNDVRYFRQEKKGVSAARNQGVRLAEGNVIAFQDADDVWPEGKLRMQVACLERHPSLDIIAGYTQFMSVAGPEGDGFAFRNAGRPLLMYHFGCALIRKTVFDKVGDLDELLSSAEDVNWFLRAMEKGVCMQALKQVTLMYRKHPMGVTHGKSLREGNFLRELKKSMDRRRLCREGVLLLTKLRHCDVPS